MQQRQPHTYSDFRVTRISSAFLLMVPFLILLFPTSPNTHMHTNRCTHSQPCRHMPPYVHRQVYTQFVLLQDLSLKLHPSSISLQGKCTWAEQHVEAVTVIQSLHMSNAFILSQEQHLQYGLSKGMRALYSQEEQAEALDMTRKKKKVINGRIWKYLLFHLH